MAEKFHERFNINIGQAEARKRFVNRAHNLVFDKYVNRIADLRGYDAYESLKRSVCMALGVRYAGQTVSDMVGDDFHNCLRGLEAVCRFSSDTTPAGLVVTILNESEVDLDIRWEKGKFLPAGAALLDDKLVNEELKWLQTAGYANVLTPFAKSLDHLLHAKNKPELLSDVITDAYEAVEGLAKNITGRDKDLSTNAELFLSKLNVSEEYKPIIKAYIAYANAFRHAAEENKKKPTVSQKEAESFIYLTGLFIRLAMPT